MSKLSSKVAFWRYSVGVIIVSVTMNSVISPIVSVKGFHQGATSGIHSLRLTNYSCHYYFSSLIVISTPSCMTGEAEYHALFFYLSRTTVNVPIHEMVRSDIFNLSKDSLLQHDCTHQTRNCLAFTQGLTTQKDMCVDETRVRGGDGNANHSEDSNAGNISEDSEKYRQQQYADNGHHKEAQQQDNADDDDDDRKLEVDMSQRDASPEEAPAETSATVISHNTEERSDDSDDKSIGDVDERLGAENAGMPTTPDTQYDLQIAFSKLPPDSSLSSIAYFLRASNEPVQLQSIEANIEYGVLSEGASLSSLQQLLSQVYLPLLFRSSSGNSGMRGLSVEDQSTEELVNTVTKFTGQVSQTMQQLEGSWKLSVPDLAVESMSVESALAQDNVLSNLERAVNEWMSTLTDALMQENTKEPDGKGPLAEIDFWRERAASLNGLCEQLESQRVIKMVELLEQSSDHANLVQQFKAQWSELTRLYLEAKDNVKFLATLERHFKNIQNGSFSTIQDTMPPMFNALRMVWIISRYYSDDSRMGNLLERIGYQITERVSSRINIRRLFEVSAEEEAMPEIESAKAVLERWESEYLKTRQRIEDSGRDARWEFDRKRLFERSNHMISVCCELWQMVKVVSDFNKFIGAELKAVTGDTDSVDKMKESVRTMITPLQDVEFDAFDIAHNEQYDP